MKTINELLTEYGESHQNSTNKMVHWICVPTIFLSIMGILYSVKLGIWLSPNFELNLADVILAAAIIYYFLLSKPLAIGMLLFALICLFICKGIESSSFTLWKFSIILFVIAWIGQFWGHNVEGKKPSFLKDIQFLMIGPAWLMSFIFQKFGIKY